MTESVALAEEVTLDSNEDEGASECMGDSVVLAVWESVADLAAVSDAIDGEARSE